MRLVYNADAVYKTPDEEIAAAVREKLKRVETSSDNRAIIYEIILSGMRRCMGRHNVDSCTMCVKLSECEIHQIDIDVNMNGIDSVINKKKSARRKKRKP